MSEHHHKHLKQHSHGIAQEVPHNEAPSDMPKHRIWYSIIVAILVIGLILLFAFLSLPVIFR